MKEGQPLEATTKYVQTGDGKKRFKLEIPNLTVTDIGQYSVKVAGKKSETQASFSLNVTISELWSAVAPYLRWMKQRANTFGECETLTNCIERKSTLTTGIIFSKLNIKLTTLYYGVLLFPFKWRLQTSKLFSDFSIAKLLSAAFPFNRPNYIKDYACNYNKQKKQKKKKVCWIFF